MFTACNRTYFGDVGRTYELEIRRPREDRLPFVCHLNFTAAGGQWGDLVQVSTIVNFITHYIISVCDNDDSKSLEIIYNIL
jgi:hypothetical protein